MRLLLQRGNWAIWLPFFLALFAYQGLSYLSAGPTITVRVQEGPTPAPGSEADEEGFKVRSSFEFKPEFWGWLSLLVLLGVGPLIAGMTVRMVINAVEGQRLLPWGELWGLIFPRLGRLVKATLMYLGAVLAGTLGLSLPGYLLMERLGAPTEAELVGVFLLILPGFYVMARLSLYLTAILLEGREAEEALRWSWRATSGNAGPLLWVITGPNVLFMLAFTPLFNVLQLLGQGLPLERALAWVLENPLGGLRYEYNPALFLVNPWTLAGLTLGHLQLREGWMRWAAPRLRRQTDENPV